MYIIENKIEIHFPKDIGTDFVFEMMCANFYFNQQKGSGENNMYYKVKKS